MLYKIKKAHILKDGKVKYKTIGYTTDLSGINLSIELKRVCKNRIPLYKAKEISMLEQAEAGYLYYSALSIFKPEKEVKC